MWKHSKYFLTLSVYGCFMAHAGEVQSLAPNVKVTPVASADVNSAGQPIVFPAKDGHVTVSMYDIPPGAILPVHEHPFPRMGYVLSGTLRVTNAETGKSDDYKAGAFVIESVGVWHKGENPAQDNLRLLVMDLIEKGANATVLRP